MKKIKVALFGCGWIGLGATYDLLRREPATHLEGILSNKSFELISLYDVDPAVIDHVKPIAPNIPFFSNLEDLFEKEVPEAVVIASTPNAHASLIKQSIARGIKHILCEKPLTEDICEANEIIELTKKYSVNLMVNHMRRYSPLLQKLRRYINRDYLRDNAIGEIISGYAYYDKGIYHAGTHIVDLLVFLLGNVKSVTGHHSNIFSKPSHDLMAEAILTFNHSQISLKPFESEHFSMTEICLIGNKGVVKLKDMFGRKIEIIGISQCMDFSAFRQLDDEKIRVFTEETPFMVNTYNYFLQSIRNYHTDKEIFVDHLHILEVLHSIEISANNNGLEQFI